MHPAAALLIVAAAAAVDGHQPIPRPAGPWGEADLRVGEGLYFQANANALPGPYRPEILSRSADGRSLRFTSGPGEVGYAKDLPERVIRNELVADRTAPNGQDVWTSFMLTVEPGPAPGPWTSLVQWRHTPDAGDTVTVPPFSIGLGPRGDAIEFSHRTSPVQPLTTTPPYRWLGSAPIVRGQAHRVVVQTRFDPSGAGLYRAWVDGTRIVDYAGPTGYADAAGPRCHFGIYRAASPAPLAVRFRNMRCGTTKPPPRWLRP